MGLAGTCLQISIQGVKRFERLGRIIGGRCLAHAQDLSLQLPGGVTLQVRLD